MTFKRTPKADLSKVFPLGSTGYVKDIPLSERIPPKGFGSAVPDPHALADVFLCRYEYVPDRSMVLKSNPGVNVGEPAPSLMMDATIDGHRYKGVLYLVSDEQEQEG